ncbi:Alg9-like mannosyltransferase family protein [Aspergillus niger]|uniref:Alg9-like mannosyltransferase family protein n=1 Tax=Aspergillus niger TaxID=5061 RepID=A0A505IDL0_ASPNG|nr:Alg9-like mannosyltransferase family protein [Aspergillus niger]
MTIQTVRLGLAVGHGTGRELVAVFERVIQTLAKQYSVKFEFVRSSSTYHSYHTLTVSGEDKNLITHIADETTKDAIDYQQFCENAAGSGIAAIFRTAIHAQSLYLVRQHLQAAKVEHFSLGEGNALLMVRDEAQGFYAGDNAYSSDQLSITRTTSFSKPVFDRIIRFALDRAAENWGPENVPKKVTMAYKFHLFDGVFQAWEPQWKAQFGIDFNFIQPDTLNRSLMANGVQGRCIIIAGNEYADVIQPVFLNWFGQSTPETMYAENVYLRPDVNGLSEYQTVHGSADAIADKGLVNPFATIRAAAAILERHAGGKGIQKLTEQAIQSLLQRKLTTPDQGAFLGLKSALVVIDFQNDFISGNPSPAMAGVVNNVPRAVDFARANNRPVIFVRFLGNTTYQSPSWKHRDAILQKPEKCVEGTWGAEFGPGVKVQPGERVFDKKALLDPFLVPEFTAYLKEQGFEHLVLAGLFSDVCIDSTARTAFQKGLRVTVVEDCTTALHSKQADHLQFMTKLYGARVSKLTELVGMTV